MTRLEELEKHRDGVQLEVLALVQIWREHRHTINEQDMAQALEEKHEELLRAERAVSAESDAIIARMRAS